MATDYKNLVIFYFSGTGNAKRSAEWIVDEAKSRGLSTYLINIDGLGKVELPKTVGKSLYGFCSPTHGFNLPPVMLKFLWNFSRSKDIDVFVLNTRAGMKLSKLFLPGLSGIAQYLAAIILKMKGYNVVGMQPIDLPSNWISLHPGLKPKVVDSIFERCERISRRFANSLLDGKKIYKAFWSLPFDLAVAPIALLYFIIGRFVIAKTFVATSKCSQCGLCIKQCPVQAIKMIRNRPYWTFSCESCMRCMNNCPERAIETAHSFLIAIWLLIASMVAPRLISLVINAGFLKSGNANKFWEIGENIFVWFIGLIVIWIGYELMHYLMHFKFFDNLVAYTSFTKYTFWRRYKIPKKPGKSVGIL